ncbi:MAG: gliding motility-associatede transport system auxiliary component [Aliidongia sp.]|nr:gliding motility-associatede transport system auxiliary component [Aliidongia sp.]
MTRSASGMTALGLLLTAILFISVNSLAGRLFGGAHVDLTDQQLFSLSSGTKAVLAKIDEPITLKLYYSKRLGEVSPGYAVFADRVQELLQEYASRANGKIDLRLLDPVTFSDIEDQATAAGLQGVPIDENGEKVYFGLVGNNSTDDREVIPFFQNDREKFLELDLTKLIQSLAFPKRKVIGLATALPLEGDVMAQMQGRPTRPLVVIDQLRQSFDVHSLSPNFDSIPDDVDVLMLAQPEKLQPKTEYAIDQWVLRGGHALVFVDPDSELQATHPTMLSPPGSPTAAEFDRVLKSWGVELVKGKVVGDRLQARRVSAGGARGQPVDYLAWLTLIDDSINHDDPVTGKLAQINIATAGALMPVAGARTVFEPLLQSSPQSELIDVDRIKQTPPDLLGLLRDFKSTDTRYTIAARISGPADTAFPDGPPVALDAQGNPVGEPDAAAKAAQIKTAQNPINVIVVADSDLLDDRFWVQVQDFFGQKVVTPQAGNADFVINAVDNLTGTGDLIGLRSRGSAVRPFTLVENKQRDAEDKYQAQEKSLQDKLKDAQSKLDEIAGKQAESEKLSPEQMQAVDQFRATIIQTRQQLRQVQLALREEIDRLKLELVALNVGAVPLIVACAAIVAGLLRLRRRKRRNAA